MRSLLPWLLAVAACAACGSVTSQGGGGGDGAVLSDAASPDAAPIPDGREDLPDGFTPADAAPGWDGPVPTTCGNGTLEPPELCDDGNDLRDDACVDCQPATCGDGDVRTGVEECDDGNARDGDTCSARCLTCALGAQATVEDGRCYWREDDARTWLEAREACVAAGGHLATIKDATEQGAELVLELAATGPVWLGLSDRVTEGEYRWTTAEPVDYLSWGPGEPAAATVADVDCIASSLGAWGTRVCGERLSRLCEDEGWLVGGPANHAYKVLHRGHTFDEAIAACAALGGHLATLATEDEATVATGLGYDVAWIGLRLEVGAGYRWTTGEDLAFTRWDRSEPSSTPCTASFATLGHVWRTSECEARLPAICEID